MAIARPGGGPRNRMPKRHQSSADTEAPARVVRRTGRPGQPIRDTRAGHGFGHRRQRHPIKNLAPI
eukprot:8120756-Lingulodinium_polyedra.AAC.1